MYIHVCVEYVYIQNVHICIDMYIYVYVKNMCIYMKPTDFAKV